ncbi:MAG TPA: hypothetical protein VKZ43_01160, partial [Trueperaceae bacterium]|nr:hypothetical protein [Trueperaceae bacterium]
MSQRSQMRPGEHSDVTELSVAELARAYRSGVLDPVTVTRAYLAAIACDPVGPRTYRVVMEERAMQQAVAAKRLLDDGIDL